jgi:hypothetical protein
MMNTSLYILEWKKALQAEIQHLKKFGSTRYLVQNGRVLTKGHTYSYFFETSSPIRIPVGSFVKLEWGGIKTEGKILSSEGANIIITLEESLGDLITEAYVYHDPWELLDQLIQRLEAIKESKKKRVRVKRLMQPSMPPKHPTEIIKSNVHELILRSKYNPITFMWGPPGTGKTYTLARVAANKYFKKKNVLLLSHSNQSVDVLLKEISLFINKQKRYSEGDVLRYGSQTSDVLTNLPAITSAQLLQNREPMLAKEKEDLIEKRRKLKGDLSRSFSRRDSDDLLKLETKVARILEKIRQKELEFLQDALVIGTTLAKAAGDPAIYEREYDVVILDEASMAYVPQAAFAASLGKHIIICGDFKQLPPIASARHELVDKWLKEDVFHRTGVAETVNKGALHPHLFLLKEQRRMHPAISAFTNQFIYHSLVGDHPSVSENRAEIAGLKPFADSASILLSTSFTGEHAFIEKSSRSRINLWHLLLAFQLIHEAYVDGASSIGYISPYRAQAQWMNILLEDIYPQEKKFADIMAATVHRFQGSERDVMIFDSVESYPFERPGMLLVGKESERLLNVAVTRTRGKFVHISDNQFLKSKVTKGKIIRKLVDFQEKYQHLVHPHDIGTWIENQHPRLQWVHARKMDRLFTDLEYANQSIISGSPFPEEWKQKINMRVKVSNVSGEVAFPFILIDHKILWVGVPLEAAKRVRPPFVSARVDSPALGEQLIKQLGISASHHCSD